jgi:hypothetical protein
VKNLVKEFLKMIQSANDWASPDPTQNMTLANAETFNYALAAAFEFGFGDMYVRTTENQIIPAAELRANSFIAPLPVNLCGLLAAAGAQEVNIAQFLASLQAAAVAGDPTGTLCQLLSQAMPGTDVPSQLTRIPAIQQVILSALQTL